MLKDWCLKLGIPLKGIFARDEKMEWNHSPCIINLGDLKGPGTHWVACWREGDVLEYFDSFGAPPPQEWLEKRKGTKFTFNSDRIQDYDSSRCGWYCLYFLDQKTKGKSFESLLSVFTSNPKENEKFVKKYFNK